MKSVERFIITNLEWKLMKSCGCVIAKVAVVFILSLLITLTQSNFTMDAEAIDIGADTDIYITVHTWKMVSVNFSTTTNMIGEVPVDELRGKIDANDNDIVEQHEVDEYARGLAAAIDEEFIGNIGQDSHTFQMLIDGNYGTFNNSVVFFGGATGSASSVNPIIFAIEMHLRYDFTREELPIHKINLNLGTFLGEEESSFNSVVLELPKTWEYNSTRLEEIDPPILFDNNRLMNISLEQSTLHEDIGNTLSQEGVMCEKFVQNGPPPNGGDNNDSKDSDEENDFLFLSWFELGIIVAIILICIVAVIVIFKKTRDV
jgi:hypothetical protein